MAVVILVYHPTIAFVTQCALSGSEIINTGTNGVSSMTSQQAALHPVRVSHIETLGTVVAPAMVALTGLLYLAGWAEQNAMLKNFGLSVGLFNEPLQATLARGYAPVCVGCVFTVAFGLIIWLLFPKMEKWSVKRYVPHVPAILVKIFWRFNRWAYSFNFAVMALFLGLLSGSISGDFKTRRVWNALDSNCAMSEKSYCARYTVGGTSYIGVLLAQDSVRAAVATKTGVRIFANDKIINVEMIGSRRILIQEQLASDFNIVEQVRKLIK
ncbi:hypothetical protein [Sphingobium sp.]|uniref:hypothetical protein n=1 Tax=Sphingobium sp. TaxID=1912891 RepID=UPI0028BEA0A7|nr:hypothetical protein [Sphingobium sp.]